jgi:O-antigen/teichoic acid export membrane protein
MTQPVDAGPPAGGPPTALRDAAVVGVRWISLARLVGEIVAFGSMVALARLIGPTEFGKFAIALVVQEIALTLTGEGIGTALVQRKTVHREHLQAGMFMSVVVGAVLAAIAFVTAPLIFTPLFGSGVTDLVRLSSPMFVVAALTAVPQAVLQRRLDFRLISLAQILSVVVRALVALALALAGLGAEALVLGAVAASTTTMAVLLYWARAPWPRLHLSAARELATFGVPAALSGLSWTGFRNADFAIIGARLGTADAGFYWRAYQLAIEYQRKIGVGVHQVAFPVYSRAEGLEEMFALRRRIARVVGALLIPSLAGLAVLAPVLVPWLFGTAWRAAIVPTQILAVAGMTTVLSDTMSAVILAAGRARHWLVYHLGCFAVYASAVYFAAARGLVAVCIAVVVVQTAITVVAYGALLRGLVERPLARLWEDLLPGAAGACAVGVAGVPATWALDRAGVPAPLTLFLAGSLAGAAAVIALWQVAPATWADLSRLARRALPGRRGSDAARKPLAQATST